MNKYLLSLIILLPLATYTVAQEAVEEEMEEIVTTGIKSSLKNAIDIFCGNQHSFYINEKHHLYSWGLNNHG